MTRVYRERRNIEVHDGRGLDDVYGRLRFAAASKLQPWDECQTIAGLHYIKVAGIRIRIADHESDSASIGTPDFNLIVMECNTDEEKRILGLISYPRLCRKAVMAKHLGLTIPTLKRLLDGWCYEHVCENEMYPSNYTQMVIVKSALLCAERAGISERIPVRQERITVDDYVRWPE